MDPQEYYQEIEEWVRQGLFTRDAILNTLSDRIRNFGILEDEEEQQLCKTFDSICTEENGTLYLSQPTFISFLGRAGFLPSSMTEAGEILYRCLINPSQAPFYQKFRSEIDIGWPPSVSGLDRLRYASMKKAKIPGLEHRPTHGESSSKAQQQSAMTRKRRLERKSSSPESNPNRKHSNFLHFTRIAANMPKQTTMTMVMRCFMIFWMLYSWPSLPLRSG